MNKHDLSNINKKNMTSLRMLTVMMCVLLLFQKAVFANFNPKQLDNSFESSVKNMFGNVDRRMTGMKEDISRSDSSLDCSKFTSDYDILASFPFKVNLNPLSQTSKVTYGLMDADDNLYELNIVSQKYVPSSVFCFKKLKQLYVRRTSFHDGDGRLPADIERLAPTLVHLGIYGSTITHLPEQIGNLRHLESLELFNTGLMSLPDSFGNLFSLKFLSLPYNMLTSLPKTIINTLLLSQIVLNNNPHLRSIQSLNGHPCLKFLQVDNCPIEQIPVNLPRLTHLYMSKNNLTNLINIRTLGYGTTDAKYFYFDQNHIQFILPQIRHVNNLHSLNLDDNQLKHLPLDIFYIDTLRNLYIRNNRFSPLELKSIVTKFNTTNPSLKLFYKNKKPSTIDS